MIERFGEHVTLTVEDHVGTVTIDRPPHNFISLEVMRDLANAIEAFDGDSEVRAFILQTAGKSFSAGADFANPGAGMAASAEAGNPLYVEALRLFSIETPIVAAVQGSAIGAGLGLALVADFRVASPEARFAANFVKLGFHPGFGMSHTLPRIIGEQRAALLLLTGRRIKAEEAFAWGLVDEVVEADELSAATRRLATEIAGNGPLGVVATRRTLRAGLVAAIAAQTDVEHRVQVELRETADFKEGVRAVAERRDGRFAGR